MRASDDRSGHRPLGHVRPLEGREAGGEAQVDQLRAVVEGTVRASNVPRILVLTHRSPDPDALGACVGARRLLVEGFDVDVEVATVGRIHRAENLAMVRELDLRFDDYSDLDPARFCGALLVDTQPTFGHTVLPKDIPLLAVFDHHRPPDEPRLEVTAVPHLDVRTGVGATSSVVYEYLRDARCPIDRDTATALFCGVRFDTADLSRNVSPLDEEAYFETFRLADRGQLARIQRPELPEEYYRELARALQVARQHGGLVLALLGSVNNPETVAELADFFLRKQGVDASIVGGAFEGVYHLSARTVYEHGEAYPILRHAMGGEGSFGGHGTIAGGRIAISEDGDIGIRRLERRLRGRALELVDPGGGHQSDARLGRAIT